jgi:hypothetical protein
VLRVKRPERAPTAAFSPEARGYTLAHVMTTWGVKFDATTLGGDTAQGDKKVHAYVNGEPAGPETPLKDGDNVVVAYGQDGSFPTEPDDAALDEA